MICFVNQFTGFYIARAPTESYLWTCFRHPNLRKPFDIVTIVQANLNVVLKIIRIPKIFDKLKSYGPLGNTLSTYINRSKTSQWAVFHKKRVLTGRYLRTDNSIVITPTLLCKLCRWFSISLWCHNSSSCICCCDYICLWFRFV